MKTIATLIMLALSFQNLETREKVSGEYTVQYLIDTEVVAFETDSIKHYEAIITVLDADSNQVYQPLRGVYADGDCVCDNPAKIVERHRALKQAEQ